LFQYLAKGFSGGKKNILSVGVAAVIWKIWKARNLTCFEKHWPREPVDIIHRVVYWITYWCTLNLQSWSCNGAQAYWEELRMKCSKLGKDGSHGHRDWKAEARKEKRWEKKTGGETRSFCNSCRENENSPLLASFFFLVLLSFLVSRGDSDCWLCLRQW
jgi:hypothetical protein